MKYQLSLILILLSGISYSQIFSVVNSGIDNMGGQIEWCDVDSDGDFDIIILGSVVDEQGSTTETSELYINNGSNVFNKLEGVFSGYIVFTILDIKDFDGDGYVDFLASEGAASTGIYKNRIVENGTVELLHSVTDYRGYGSMNDFDNDGVLDVIFSGQKFLQGSGGGWYFKSAVYLFTGDGFAELTIDPQVDTYFTNSIRAIDFDVDGDLDIVLTGQYEDSNIDSNSETRLYINNNGLLEKTVLDTIGISARNIDVTDFNNDGYPEVALSGSYNLQVTPTSTKKIPVTNLYLNEVGQNFSKDQVNTIMPAIDAKLMFGDYNNDGQSDLVINGVGVEDNNVFHRNKIYSNSGGIFTEETDEIFPNIAHGSSKWADYDNDGDLDLAISGFVEDYSSTFFSIYENTDPSTNNAPDMPTNLITDFIDEKFELSWTASTDNETNSESITYNLYLRNETDTVFSSNSFINGKRKIIQNGNLGYGTSHYLSRFMEPGDYYWSVQAIDNGFKGSSFAPEETFHVNYPPIIISGEKEPQLEEISFSIDLEDLQIDDPDNSFPEDFTLTILGGPNYNFSENTITPYKDFYGQLLIPILVQDHLDASQIFEMSIEIQNVNDIPEIISQNDPFSTNEDQSIFLSLTDFSVINLDSDYPNGFTLHLDSGDHYSINGTTIIPDTDYHGILDISVYVNDGEDNSPIFNTTVEVSPVNDIPFIFDQVEKSTPEDNPIEILFSDIFVRNLDVPYPEGFTMTIGDGLNYSLDDFTIIPDKDYFGFLRIMLKVNDGEDDSQIFDFILEVSPINDIPVITSQLNELTTIEGVPLEISLNDIAVENLDVEYPSGFTLSIQESPSYTIQENSIIPNDGSEGLLEVPITVNDGEDESEVFNLQVLVDAPLSLVKDQFEGGPFVYPNPFKDFLIIYSEFPNQQLSIQIMDLAGKIIYSGRMVSGEESMLIELGEVPEGLLVARIEVNGQFFTARLIKKDKY